MCRIFSFSRRKIDSRKNLKRISVFPGFIYRKQTILKSFIRIGFMNSVENRILSLITHFFDALDMLFYALRWPLHFEKRTRTNCTNKNWPRSLRVLSIPRVKILDSKVCYRRTCERDDSRRSRGGRHSRDFR